MEGEMRNYVKVWLIAITCACYCYTLPKAIPSGFMRLLFVLPVIYLFTILPFSISSIHLGVTTFFFLFWLGNSKLLLFSFGLGPLSEPLSLPHFVCFLLLPIKKKTGFGAAMPSPSCPIFAVKLVVLACVVGSYNYKQSLPRIVLPALYCCHIYLDLETTLVISWAIALAYLGLQLVPLFDEPYLATSLQDFWGRRWNLMASDTLRQTIYNPIVIVTSPFIGKKRAMLIGILASFLVSGLLHELFYYCMTRASPTWEVTLFFVLHGACTAMEVMIIKKISSKWQLNRAISGALTLGFIIVTADWLFFPPIFRNKVHEKIIDEYLILVDFVKSNVPYWPLH